MELVAENLTCHFAHVGPDEGKADAAAGIGRCMRGGRCGSLSGGI
jgi:hypothetical protein